MDSPLCFLPQMASDKAIKTRQSILDAAKAIIIEEGIGALTMERAATKAGISKGACMYHFKSKRALQAALVEEYAAHLSSELARHEALFDGPPEETLVPGFIEWFRSFDHDNHGWSTVGLAIHSNFVHDEELMRPVKVDLVSPKLKIQAWHFILENLVHNHAAAQTKH